MDAVKRGWKPEELTGTILKVFCGVYQATGAWKPPQEPNFPIWPRDVASKRIPGDRVKGG
jgi:hypothetical protein